MKVILWMVKPLINGLIGAIAYLFWGIVEMALKLLDDIIVIFEKIAFESWSDVIFGKSPNSSTFRFFPNTSSPLFYVWLSSIGFGILLLSIFLVTFAIKKIQSQSSIVEDDKEVDKPSSRVIGKMSLVAVSIFTIPFLLITGMGITSSITKMVFPTTKNARANLKIDNYQSEFDSQFGSISSSLYDFVKQKDFAVSKNGNDKDVKVDNAYFETDESKQNVVPKLSNTEKKFKDKNIYGVLSELQAHLNSFEVLIKTRSSQSLIDKTTSLISLIDAYLKNWDSSRDGKNIESIINKLKSYNLSASNDSIDSQRAKEVADLKKTFGLYVEETSALLSSVSDFVSNQSQFVSFFPNSQIKLKNIDNVNTNILLSYTANDKKQGASKFIEYQDTKSIVLFSNIKNITNHILIKPEQTTSGNDIPYKRPDKRKVNIFENLGLTKNKYMSIYIDNMYALLNGVTIGEKTYNIYDIEKAYSGRENLSITQIIYEVASGNKGTDYSRTPSFDNLNETIPRILIALAMLVSALLIIGRLIAKIIIRFMKIAWLWIMGALIMPTSISDGGGKTKIWINMVIIEIISIFSLMSMWYLWKSISEPIKDMVYGYQGDEIALGLATYFALIAVISAIPMVTDWFAKIIGGGSINGYSSSLAGGGGAVAGAVSGAAFASVRAGGARMAKIASVGRPKKLLGGINKVYGTYDPWTGDRRGGLLGRNGIKERAEDFNKSRKLKKNNPSLSRINRKKIIEKDKERMPAIYDQKTGKMNNARGNLSPTTNDPEGIKPSQSNLVPKTVRNKVSQKRNPKPKPKKGGKK